MNLGDKIKELYPDLKELICLCAMMLFSLVLFNLGQLNIWVFILGLFALPLIFIYVLEITVFYLLGINRLVGTNISNRFMTAILFIVATVYDKTIFFYGKIIFIFVSALIIVGQGTINRLISIIQNSSKTENASKNLYINDKNTYYCIISLFIRNLAFTIVIIGIIQYLIYPPDNLGFLFYDVSEHQWIRTLFSMSCTLWVIATSAYFLRLNCDVLTCKRVQATMAAIFLICGLATTLLFKNTILVWSALAAPIIYLLLQNRHSKTNACDLSHSS